MGRATPQDLRTFLAKFDLEWALRSVALASNWLTNNRQTLNRDLGVAVTPWILAFLAKEIICWCGWRDNRLPFKTDELRKASELYGDFSDPLESETPESDPIALQRAFILLANLQYPFQERHLLSAARMAILLSDMPGLTHRGPNIDIGERLDAIHGMSAERIIRTGVAINVASLRSSSPAPVLSLKRLSEANIPEMKAELDLSNLRRFVKEFGADVNTFRDRSVSHAADSPYVKYSFNELQSTPLIAFSDDLVCIPVHSYLLQRISSGLFFSLSDDADGGDKRNPFREKFGHIFEEYVGEQLRKNTEGFKVYPAITYARSKLSPDWILVRGQDAVLVECKSSQLSVGAKTYASDRFIDKDGRKIFEKSVRQISEFVRYNELNPGKIPALQEVRRFFGLTVCYAPLYLANTLYPTLFPEVTQSVPKSLQDYQFLSIGELEMLLGLLGCHDLIHILERCSRPSDRPEAMGDFLRDEFGIPAPNPMLIQKVKSLFGISISGASPE